MIQDSSAMRLPSVLGILLSVLVPLTVWSASPAQESTPYASYFEEGWSVTILKSSLPADENPDDRPECEVLAYGWKMLAEEERSEQRDLWRKWAWRVLVGNKDRSNPILIDLTVDAQLISTDRFTLDSSGLEIDYEPRINSGLEGERLMKRASVDEGAIRLYQSTSWYNATAHAGEGEPANIDLSAYCRVQTYRISLSDSVDTAPDP